MASSTAQLSLPTMRGDDQEFEAFQANDAILMSLLEEFQEDDRDDEERVNTLIQSLEAEIATPSPTMESNDSSYIGDECSGSSFDSELGWFDMEQVPCSPSDDMNWYMESCDYEMDCLNDSSIWVGDNSHICYEAGLEDNGFTSIWQENAFDSIMYDWAKYWHCQFATPNFM